jgi:NAD(P)-dependent dehydrogenase (short-subunit alcohol dehydrogenase family)
MDSARAGSAVGPVLAVVSWARLGVARDAAAGPPASDGLGAGYLRIEVTDDGSGAAGAERVRRRYGPRDVPINNAGMRWSATDIVRWLHANTCGN